MTGRCTASVVIRDDHWGGYRDECELGAGHPGPHVSKRPCCTPPAWLSWVDAPPEAVSGATGAASGLSDESGGGQ